jgi:hypothetical protein
MSIKDTIFKGPVDIPTLRKEGKSDAELVDSLWINFMHYARHNWHYIASSKSGGKDLLSGDSTSAPCGGIATALKMMIEEYLHQTVDYITISGYVWTKPEFHSFDSLVKGNVSRYESPLLFEEGCIFNEHYFIKCNGKYYDPCLDSTYRNEKEAVRKEYLFTEIIAKGEVMAGLTADSLVVFNKAVIVPGFTVGAWHLVKEKDIFKVVTDKAILLAISCSLKHGKIALKARQQSKQLYESAGRLEGWQNAHRKKGIVV